MAFSYFIDKSRPPESDEVNQILGTAQPLWTQIVDFISSTYAMVGDMTYGGKKYGWNLWYRKSGKTLVSLYPAENAFIAQIVLGREQVENALLLSLGVNFYRVLRETPSLHDGRWLFVKVTTERDVADLQEMLLVKKRPAKKKT